VLAGGVLAGGVLAGGVLAGACSRWATCWAIINRALVTVG
jgi:hypothetical protein